ncbi:MAG: hypothetical protein IKY37_08510 [Bacteroidaceae bacterium]|nr:hypothetical protein [Bacteroidaceae bacterium]
MGQTNYIVAIELSSSKVTGAAGIETHNGIKIIATASTRVDGYISKGIVRNVDKTGEAITNIINSLESNIIEDAGKDIMIKKAYVSLSGLTLRSIKSSITKNFDSYTKITSDIISELEDENDMTFQIPEGYIKVQAITQEYKVDGKTERAPIGTLAQTIEGHFLNIIIKKQHFEQLNESFALAKTEIADSYIAARMDAEIILTKDDRRNGCALVNIGADTTTIIVYNNDCLRKISVIPFGSNNITQDMCAEQISYDQAEATKITRGYRSQSNEKEPIDNDTLNDIISGRMCEILQNVKYQIEESGEPIRKIVFTGGGSKLKNLALLLEEYLPDYATSIASDPQLAFECRPGVNTFGIFTTALYGLLSHGKENCCEEMVMEVPTHNGTLFTADDMSGKEEEKVEEVEKPKEQNEEKKDDKNGNKKGDKKSDKNGGKNASGKSGGWFGGLFETVGDIIKIATREDPEPEKENEE